MQEAECQLPQNCLIHRHSGINSSISLPYGISLPCGLGLTLIVCHPVGLVSQLPPEITGYYSRSGQYRFHRAVSPQLRLSVEHRAHPGLCGNGLTLNGPGAEAFEHRHQAIQNSGTEVLGRDFWQRPGPFGRSRRMPRIMVETSMASVLTAQIPDNPVVCYYR